MNQSAASSCIDYLFSGAVREKFKVLIGSQKNSPERYRKQTHWTTEEERQKIREAREKGLSWKELGVMFDRSPFCCQVAVRGKFYKKTQK
jgi:hypothetical protein